MSSEVLAVPDSAELRPTGVIDLRSDTVTRPTPAMRAAMAAAEVGDDVYGEDPTINLLQEKAAAIFGREAAIFVPTGTMGNQVAIRLHTAAWAGSDLRIQGAHWRVGNGDGVGLLRLPSADGACRARHPEMAGY